MHRADVHRRPQRRRRNLAAPLLGALLVLLVVGGAALVLLHPWKYDVTINGSEVTVPRNVTIDKVIEQGLASPTPGNLMAVDGSVAQEGGGDRFSAVVDGQATTDGETKLKRGAVVEISDGADVTEAFTSTEEAIPHGERTWITDASSYWNGSLHVFEEGSDGLKVTKTGEVSGLTVTEQTSDPVDSGYHIYTANVGEDKVLALTFDDGPWPETTDAILDVLEQNGAHATFFTIGNQIPDYTAQVQREHALGCEVCTHTYDHAAGSGQGVNLTYMSAEEQIWEVEQGMAAIRDAIGEEPPRVMRAPGGNFYGDILYTLAPYLTAEVGWDVDTEDWRLPGSDAIYEAIMSARPGQVVLMHDGGGDRWQTVEAVKRAVPELIAAGYQLVTVDELLAYDSSTAETVSVG